MRRSLSPLLVLPGFLGFTVAIPSYQSANATERDDNGTNADVGANSKSASLESFCAAQLSSFTATYQSTEIATSRWTWYEGFGPTDSAGDLTGSVTSQTYWTSTFLCTIDFYFWPDQATPTAPAPGQPSTSVNADGFTFTSPSVYMAFSSLAASDKCGQVGDIWTSTTIAFDPTEITTAQPITTLTQYESDYVSDDGSTYRSMGDAVTTEPPPKLVNYDEVGQNCSTIPGYVYWPDNPINAANALYHPDPCHPVILLPPRLISMQQPWVNANCGPSPGMSGAYDPPRVLTPMLTGTELATPTPHWGGRVSGDGDASPASSAEAVAPSTTTRPVSTGVTAEYASADPSSSAAESVATVTLTADAVTTAIVVSGKHVGTDSVTGVAAAILSGLGGTGTGSESDSEAASQAVSQAASGHASQVGESPSKWNPTQAIAATVVTASSAIAPSSSGSGKKVSSSSSSISRSSSSAASANTASTTAAAAATSSGAAASGTIADSAIWSLLAPLLLFWI
ncbi:hypothetical protein D6C79_01508 [Aureobasidium pullulans]|nr:hypothetical protein D6C79_01508 [Aureobasidium pullulans]